jgi:hypothetical protein
MNESKAVSLHTHEHTNNAEKTNDGNCDTVLGTKQQTTSEINGKEKA